MTDQFEEQAATLVPGHPEFVSGVARALREAAFLNQPYYERGWNDAVEECGARLSEIAEGLRMRAQSTRENWTGDDVSKEDRQANYADARNDEAMARTYDNAATAVRILAIKEGPGR